MIMMQRYKILGLYKNLLRYSQTLKYTDPKYFVHRVRKSFLDNKDLTNEKDIEFQYKLISFEEKLIKLQFLDQSNLKSKGLMLLQRKRVV